MPQLYLVRHAQPDFAGHYDSVTELGLRQSAWLGEHFAARGLRFARVLSGSLVRQVDTLAAALERMPGNPEPVADARFNEYDAAAVLTFAHRGDEPALRASGDRRRYFAAVREALHAWSKEDEPPKGVESWRAFGERVAAAATEACAGLERSDTVLVVTSGGVIGRLVAQTLGAGADAAIALNLQTRNTGVTELVRGVSVSRLVSFNSVPHLERPDREHAVTHS
jgi:broad specificity phosphatase PhoE